MVEEDEGDGWSNIYPTLREESTEDYSEGDYIIDDRGIRPRTEVPPVRQLVQKNI